MRSIIQNRLPMTTPLNLRTPSSALVLVLGLAAAGEAPAQAPDSQALPPARAHHALTWDETRGQVVLYGGSTPRDDGFVFFDDVWAWDGIRWTLVARTGVGRSGHQLIGDRGGLLLVGGYDGRQGVGETRLFDGTTWEPDRGTGTPAYPEAAVARDLKRGNLILFGGSAPNRTISRDTWTYDGARWSKLSLSGPPGVQASAMVYDAARGVMVLFGGIDSARAMAGETWIYNGTGWSRSAAVGPSPRASAGMVYDPVRRQVILFGGMTREGARGDTWLWDGERWTAGPAEGPGPRAMGYMAFDERRGVAVLFGGRRKYPDDLNDTWEFDGTTWRRR